MGGTTFLEDSGILPPKQFTTGFFFEKIRDENNLEF